MPTLEDIINGVLNQNQPQQGALSAVLMNPMLSRQGDAIRERKFLSGIMATPWYSEFLRQYGEPPDLSKNADYDYRSAWAAGIRPTQDPYDNNRYHWPSSLPNGSMLKSENHPTAWKEHYMRLTGKNPDAVGATIEDYVRLQQGK